MCVKRVGSEEEELVYIIIFLSVCLRGRSWQGHCFIPTTWGTDGKIAESTRCSSETNKFSAHWSGLVTVMGSLLVNTCLHTLPCGPAPLPTPSLCILLIYFIDRRYRQPSVSNPGLAPDTTHLPTQTPRLYLEGCVHVWA